MTALPARAVPRSQHVVAYASPQRLESPLPAPSVAPVLPMLVEEHAPPLSQLARLVAALGYARKLLAPLVARYVHLLRQPVHQQSLAADFV